jgi:hypothetical protein
MARNGAATDSPLSHNIDFLDLQAVIILDGIPLILILLAYKSITHKEGRETCMLYVGDKFMYVSCWW